MAQCIWCGKEADEVVRRYHPQARRELNLCAGCVSELLRPHEPSRDLLRVLRWVPIAALAWCGYAILKFGFELDHHGAYVPHWFGDRSTIYWGLILGNALILALALGVPGWLRRRKYARCVAIAGLFAISFIVTAGLIWMEASEYRPPPLCQSDDSGRVECRPRIGSRLWQAICLDEDQGESAPAPAFGRMPCPCGACKPDFRRPPDIFGV